MLEVRLLGAFHIKSGKKIVTLASRPAQSLFAFLILNAGTSYRREKLAGLLWPDSTEESARDYLRHALWRIRKALQEASSAKYLMADDLTIGFDASSDYWLDAAVLRDVNEAGPVEALMDALSAYRGELLPGFYDEWVVLEREQLQSVYEREAACLLDLLQKNQRWAEVLDWGERWIAFGQKPEAAYRYLMLAHAAQGDMGKASATYERCQKALTEFGVEPSDATKRVLAGIRAGQYQVPSSPQVRKALTPHDRRAPRLPVPLTGFVGREKELDEITRILNGTRLLTLVGPGGVGKTRLAIEVAQRLEKQFKDGVLWVDLVGLSDPDLVPQGIVHATGLPEAPNQSPTDALIEHFSTRSCVMILDNCEHLISACAQIAAQLLAGSRQLKIMTTSREALDILGETTWTVPSLSLPDLGDTVHIASLSKFESVRLFLERMASAVPGYELTEQNAGAVVQICYRLSGIPLAIELAAARARMMSVEEIARHLEDSFDLLTSGNRAALPRHQTLRAAIDWSYQLLTQPEQILFRRLAIFAGGFTLEAAEEITSDQSLLKAEILHMLGRLISKSIVTTQASPAGLETRYYMLETIRQYARERLEAADEVGWLRRRHLAYFAEFASRAGTKLMGAATVESWQRVAADVENLRLALNWADADLPQDPESRRDVLDNRYQIIGALGDFWESRFRNEILQLLDRLLAMDVEKRPTAQRASALSSGGFIQWSLHHFDDARRYLDQSLAVAESIGDQLTAAWALSHLGWNADFVGDYESAHALGMKSLAIARSLGDEGRYILGQSLSFLGDIPYAQDNLVEARRLYEEAASFLREIKEVNRLTYPVRRLGYVALREGNPSEAASLFAESLELNRKVGHLPGMVACIAGLAAASLAAGQPGRAAALYGWVEHQLLRIGAPFFFIDTIEYEHGVAKLKEGMDPERIERAMAKGRPMTLEEAIEFAVKA
jgi:predicted ATPase/DNA-binding SARP family transcriptional activator